jgi:hypothetical protein
VVPQEGPEVEVEVGLHVILLLQVDIEGRLTVKLADLQADVVGGLAVKLADLLVGHLHLDSDPSAS